MYVKCSGAVLPKDILPDGGGGGGGGGGGRTQLHGSQGQEKHLDRVDVE